MHKKLMILNESGQRKSGSNLPQIHKQKGIYHHLPVHLSPKTEVSIMERIHITSMLDQRNPKVVW